MITLAEDFDEDHLNEIHCFARKHIEIFAADDKDIAAPSPGRKVRVVHGQVGIRCIHCVALPQRVKRAICYPRNVNGIYHAVSNMKFDHFAKCPGLPPQAQQEFRDLQDRYCRRGSNGSSKPSLDMKKKSSTSTALYYEMSAIRKGLVDTDAGIRFGPKKMSPPKKTAVAASSPPPLTGLSALVQAACVV